MDMLALTLPPFSELNTYLLAAVSAFLIGKEIYSTYKVGSDAKKTAQQLLVDGSTKTAREVAEENAELAIVRKEKIIELTEKITTLITERDAERAARKRAQEDVNTLTQDNLIRIADTLKFKNEKEALEKDIAELEARLKDIEKRYGKTDISH